MYMVLSYKHGLKLCTPFPNEDSAHEFAKSLHSGRIIEVWGPCSCDDMDEPHAELHCQYRNGEDVSFVEVDATTGKEVEHV
jgi:hypothetical protein